MDDNISSLLVLASLQDISDVSLDQSTWLKASEVAQVCLSCFSILGSTYMWRKEDLLWVKLSESWVAEYQRICDKDALCRLILICLEWALSDLRRFFSEILSRLPWSESALGGWNLSLLFTTRQMPRVSFCGSCKHVNTEHPYNIQGIIQIQKLITLVWFACIVLSNPEIVHGKLPLYWELFLRPWNLRSNICCEIHGSQISNWTVCLH